MQMRSSVIGCFRDAGIAETRSNSSKDSLPENWRERVINLSVDRFIDMLPQLQRDCGATQPHRYIIYAANCLNSDK